MLSVEPRAWTWTWTWCALSHQIECLAAEPNDSESECSDGDESPDERRRSLPLGLLIGGEGAPLPGDLEWAAMLPAAVAPPPALGALPASGKKTDTSRHSQPTLLTCFSCACEAVTLSPSTCYFQ